MPRDKQYLIDIFESAKMILTYVEGQTWEKFLDDVRTQDAVIRRFEIIGEAARHISDEAQSKYKDLPWREMIGMRNLAIHEYDAVDFAIVWDTIRQNLPPLIKTLEKILD